MKATRIIALLLSLMLTLGVCFALASCGTPEPDDDGEDECTMHTDENGDGVCDTEGCGATVTPAPTPSGDQFNEKGELMLFKGGAPTFQIVLGSDVGSAASGVNDIVKVLNGLCTKEIKVATTADPVEEVEILVGTVSNRGSEYKIDKYTLGEKGYVVKQIGTKIVVLGGSSASLTTAISYLKETVFGLKKNNEKFTDFAMASANNTEKIQSDYNVSSVTIAGNSIKDYVIVSNKKASDKTAKAIADKLQDNLYKEIGVHLDTETGTEPIENKLSIVIRTVENDFTSDGYSVKVDEDGNLIIECMFEYLFEEATDDFFDRMIFSKKGKVSIGSDYEYTEDMLNIRYEDFGAVSEDGLNDFDAIYEAHELANLHGHTVHATPGAVYDILKTGGRTAVIMTNTYWYDAEFIVDDTSFEYNDNAERGANIFEIKSGSTQQSYTPNANGNAIEKKLAELTAGGLKKDELKSFDIGLGRAAMIYIVDTEHKNYVRYGINADNGQNQMEFIVVDEEGNIDPTTYLLYDYAHVSYVRVVYVDDAPITVSGGKVTTVANNFPRNYDWYTARGIRITRSNSTLDGLSHVIVGEGENGAPYNGFINVTNCHNATVKNCTLSAHKAYSLETNASNVMGTYDLAPNSANDVHFYNVRMHNFYVEVGGKEVISVNNGWWGIMGGNDCKNLIVEKCQLTRVDAHRGTYNITIKDSDVANITIIGGGKLTISDSRIHMATSSQKYLVTLRVDYGSTWNGEFEIVNTQAVLPDDSTVSNTFCLIYGEWNEINMAASRHDFGYDCYMPHTVTLDNFDVVDRSGKHLSMINTISLAIGSIAAADIGKTTVNPYYVTEKWIVKNNTAGFILDCNITDAILEVE